MGAPASGDGAAELSAQDAHRLLTQPGSRFEMEDATIRGLPMRVWKHSPGTFADIFSISIAFGDREFMIYEADRVSYAAFGKATARLAQALLAQGVGKGDVVAIVMPNRPEWVVAWFAILLIGAIAAPLNPGVPQAELEFLLRDSGARLAIGDLGRVSALRQAMATCPALGAIIAGPGAIPAKDTNVIALDDILGPAAAWNDLPAAVIPAVALQPDDDAILFYTSGTTGQPKGVLTSHRANVYNIFHAGFRLARRFLLEGLPMPESDPAKTPAQINLVAVPLFHVSGSSSHVLVIMPRGGKIVFMRWWTPELALRLIEREGVNLMGGVPTVAVQILEHPKRSQYDLSSLQQVVYGGAPSPPRLIERIVEAGMIPAQNWGMTETCGSVVGHFGPEFRRRPQSCGLPAPVNELRVTDPKTGGVLDPGAIGELWIRGPQTMSRYWNNPDLTAQVLRDGWLRTGDIAYLDGDGYCHIVDRAKDMLICAGENIYCPEIENALYQHPDVLEAAALGLPHADFGEQPVAVVRLRPGCGLNERALRAFAGEHLASSKVPVRILIQEDALPRNDSGKVTKFSLRQMFETDAIDA